MDAALSALVLYNEEGFFLCVCVFFRWSDTGRCSRPLKSQ